MKSPTITTTPAEQATSIKMEVCRLLQWTEEDYAYFQYEHGIAYLMWYLPCDEHARRQLERSRLYWNWFKKQFALHDESMLTYKRSLSEMSLRQIRQLYEDLHDSQTLAIEVKPNEIVLSEIKKSNHVISVTRS